LGVYSEIVKDGRLDGIAPFLACLWLAAVFVYAIYGYMFPNAVARGFYRGRKWRLFRRGEGPEPPSMPVAEHVIKLISLFLMAVLPLIAAAIYYNNF